MKRKSRPKGSCDNPAGVEAPTATLDGKTQSKAKQKRRKVDRKVDAADPCTIVRAPKADGDDDKKPHKSQADLLVEFSATMELFHTPGTDGETFASVQVAGHRETLPVKSKAFREFLCGEFYRKHEKAPGSQAVQDAINVIAAKAQYDGPCWETGVRLAVKDDAIWLDLADDAWQAVEVTPTGWRVVGSSDVPIRFLRKNGQLPLPEPVAGGNISELRQFVNLPDDDQWCLYLSWLIQAFNPRGPHPILSINGEQGSAKSTACRLARSLIDPNRVPLRRPPQHDRDLMIAAKNGWVVGYDNLSGIPPALSDALCGLSTGGGFGTRELYSDDGEKLFQAMRPVMINGIEDLATRSDFLDRCVNLTLPVIADVQRRSERDLLAAFELAKPSILGALLDAVSAALRSYATVKLPGLPRMADFAMWATAAEAALGFASGDFLRAYTGNRAASNDLAVDCSAIGPSIVALVEAEGSWHGTYKELLNELEQSYSDEKTKFRREWPRSPRKLSGELSRIAPNLRAVGIDVSIGEKTSRGKYVSLARVGAPASTPSQQSFEEIGDFEPEPTIPDCDDDRDGQMQQPSNEEGGVLTL